MTRYAQNTTVSSEASRAEIERLIRRYGADQFAYGWDGNSAVVGFRITSRHIRFKIDMPRQDDTQFMRSPTGRQKRSGIAVEKAWEQATRQRWRALALVIKAKLEAVESGISSLEQEFMAWTVMPGGQTVGDMVLPRIAEAYTTGKDIPLLEFGGKR